MSIAHRLALWTLVSAACAACGEIETLRAPDADAAIDAHEGDAPKSVGCSTACGANAICANVGEADRCQCLPGFSGDGFICTNIDECATGVHMCDPATRCTDRAPSYECSACPSGTKDMDPGVGTKCQTDVPDSMQLTTAGVAAQPACGTVADADLDGDGVDGQLSAALLVNAATGVDGPANGRNPKKPLKTIGYAVMVAAADIDRNQIYVAATDEQGQPLTYAENVVLPRGLHLFGGYTHLFASRDPQQRTLVAPTAGVPLRVDYTVGDEAGTFMLEGFTFKAPPAAPGSGGSSIAAVVSGGAAPESAASPDAGADAGDAGAAALTQLVLLNSSLEAAQGASGSNGNRGGDGAVGCRGKMGLPNSSVRSTGFQDTSGCFPQAPGGYGGAGRGYVGEDGGDSGDVKGGAGGKKDNLGYSVCWCPQSVGDDGESGGLGPPAADVTRPAAPAQPLGQVALVNGVPTWQPAIGTTGGPGTPGKGGSGGGASYGACGGSPCTGIAGSSGGEGGGGGEAGKGGDGGGGGGASLGLLLASAHARLACLSITTAAGGAGGKGGPGGLGGRGGDGGPGGVPGFITTSRSGTGGKGGPGSEGRGGFAGQGGRGGLSVGVLLAQARAEGLEATEGSDTHAIAIGQPGAGGAASDGERPGYAGEAGVAARVLTLP